MTLFRGKRLLVFLGIYGFPFALHDSFPNLGGRLAFLNLFVSVEILVDARAAFRAVRAGKAIQQAGVAFAPIAVAIARLLIERFLDLRRDRIRILHDRLVEEFRVHGCRELAFGSLGMKGFGRTSGYLHHHQLSPLLHCISCDAATIYRTALLTYRMISLVRF